MLKATVKISRKGQIVIPKSFRDRLKTNLLDIEMDKDEIVIKPSGSILSLGRALKDYKKQNDEKEAWTNHVKEKYKTN